MDAMGTIESRANDRNEITEKKWAQRVLLLVRNSLMLSE